MKISVVTSVFINYQLKDAVQCIHELGVKGVDVWCGRPHAYRKDYSENELIKIGKDLKEKGLTAVSLMPAFAHYPYSLSSPIEAIRKDSIGYMKDCIDNAVLMGAPYVLVVPKQSLYGQTREESRKLFLDSLCDVSDYGKQKGITMVLEIVYPKLSDHMGLVSDALCMIKDSGCDNIGVALDSGHLNLSGEDATQAVYRLGDLLLQIHVNDNDQVHQQNKIPGEGKFDFPGFMHCLRESGYNGFLSIELGWAYSFDPVPALEEAITRLKGF